MLVLTRKTDEQILIGDNIKITLVRVRGNSVRIGIDAPRDLRVIRGELKSTDSADDKDTQPETAVIETKEADRERVLTYQRIKTVGDAANRDDEEPVRLASSTGRLTGDVRRAPLAQFVSAT